jgi:hypothetical protein
VKSLVFQPDVKQKESVFALVCKTLKCTSLPPPLLRCMPVSVSVLSLSSCAAPVKTVLEQLVASAKIFEEQRQVQPNHHPKLAVC